LTWLHAGSEIVSVLTALFPRVQIIDASCPSFAFHWLHGDVIALEHPACFASEYEQRFYARFRQHGGHLKLLSIDDLLGDSGFRRTWDWEPGKAPVVAMAARQCGTLLQALRAMPEDTAFLVHDPNHDPAVLAAIEAIDPRGAISMRMTRGEHAETFHLLSRATLGDAPADITIAAAKTFAVNLRFEVPRAACIDYAIHIMLPEDGGFPTRATLDPKRMIHDGGRRCESTGDYSWLWIDAERHLRILLGSVPRHFTSLRVVVPKAFTTQNLRETKILLNGRRVIPDVETWEEGAGALTVTLPPLDSELVLGIAAHATRTLDDGQTRLALCIDRIELRA
jgi:hypothetical protein